MRELCSADQNPLGLHVVEEGETLVSLCEKYCVSEHEVIRLNGLHAFPPPGTVLLLPPPAGKVYVVQPGETLSSVCKKYDMSEEEFAARNGDTFLYPMRRVLVKE